MNSRRAFLKSSAGLAAALAARPLAGSAQESAAATFPKVRFGKHEISRLVVGCNQFYGFSHFNPVARPIDARMEYAGARVRHPPPV